MKVSYLDLPRAMIIVNNAPVLQVLVATGRFIGIIPAPLPMVAASPDKVLPIELPTARRPIAVVTLKTRTPQPRAQALVKSPRH